MKTDIPNALMDATHKPMSANSDVFLASIQTPALRAIAQHWNAPRGPQLLPSWETLRLEQLPQPARLICGDRRKNADVYRVNFTVNRRDPPARAEDQPFQAKNAARG